MTLLCLPSAPGNPYQRLMYARLKDDMSIAYAGPGGLRELTDPAVTVVHLHWDDRLFGRSRDTAEEFENQKHAFAQLAAFQTRGGQVVWTVHNREPHKIINLEAFTKGRQALSDLADTIHVHAPHARDHLIDTYRTDPGKIHVIPHPSYLGAYEPEMDTLGRGLASQDSRSFLFFGMFRGSKGIHKIRDVAGKLTRRQVPYHLKMYGKGFASQARLLRVLGANPNIDLRTDRIPDAELPAIFGDAQVFLAPYDSLFTSGSVMLALTFGLPIVGPNIRELRETTPEACHHLLYDPNAPRGLIRSMLQFIEMDDEELSRLRRSCLIYAQDRAPEKIGAAFADLLAAPRKMSHTLKTKVIATKGATTDAKG